MSRRLLRALHTGHTTSPRGFTLCVMQPLQGGQGREQQLRPSRGLSVAPLIGSADAVADARDV